MRPISPQLSQEDLQAVEAAVRKAESATTGEIVTYITTSSDEYHLAAWKGALYGALLGSQMIAILLGVSGRWIGWIEAWVALPPLLGGTLGYFLVLASPGLRRWLVETEILAERVERRAYEVFTQEEVFDTRGRSGVLLYVSLLERRAQVLPDRGLRARVPEREWERVVDEVTGGFRGGAAGSGLVRAVEECGRILARHVGHSGVQENELADPPRFDRRPFEEEE